MENKTCEEEVLLMVERCDGVVNSVRATPLFD